MIGRAPRQLSQRSYLLIREIRERSEKLARQDTRLRNMRDAVEPVPGRYINAPPPKGKPLLSAAALDTLYEQGE